MARLVRESPREPIVRETALDLLRTLYASHYADFVYSLKTYFVRHFRFIDEPDEMIMQPSVMVRTIADSGSVWGDCDDAAVLAGALMYSLGFSIRFRAIIEQPDGSFAHVFTEYTLPNAQFWRVFDPTINFEPRYTSSLVEVV